MEIPNQKQNRNCS